MNQQEPRQRKYNDEESEAKPSEGRTFTIGSIAVAIMMVSIAMLELFVIYQVIRNVFFN